MDNIQNYVAGVWERLRGRGFADVAGASVTVEVPLRQGFLNEVIAAGLAEKPSPIKRISVVIRGGGRIGVEIDPHFFLLPTFRLELDIQDTVDCREDPTLRLRVAPESFSTALLLQGANLFTPPPGVTVTNQQIALHLPTLLAQGNLGYLTPLLHFIIIASAPGILLIRTYFVVPSYAGDASN